MIIKTAALVLALAAAAAAAPVACTTGSHTVDVKYIQDGPSTFGCNGYQPNSQYRFNLGTGGIYIQADKVDLEGADPLTIYCGNDVLQRVTATTIALTTERSCDANVRFTSDRSVQQAGFTFTTIKADSVTLTRDSLETAKIQEYLPGFHYYVVSGTMQKLSQLSVTLGLESSSGLRPPTLFVSGGRLPTLEQPGTRADVSSGRAVATLDPGLAPQVWYVGVFLYGVGASYTLKAEGTVSTRAVPLLTNGEIVNVTAVPGATQFFQTPRIGANSPQLTVEMSRQVPGGYPKLLVCQGMICEAPDSPYYYGEIDTATSPYGTVVVPTPAQYPYAPSNKYYLAVQSTHDERGAAVVRVKW